MNSQEVISKLTLDEKISLLTGTGNMQTAGVERLGIKPKNFADGPHGIRSTVEDNCTAFPCLSLLGATWDVDSAYKMGKHIGKDCVKHNIDMILGPGINIKRHMLCGRNFEYVSEDPVLSGEVSAAYINGVQDCGVGVSLKHYAANNQEKYRTHTSVDVDVRTLMEIYLKGFEIAVKKSSPASIMCAYNKIHSIWCAENKYLLTDILKKTWGYEGFVVSDWGAVHDAAKSVKAGLDLQMPQDSEIHTKIKTALDSGELSVEELDTAVIRILDFLLQNPEKDTDYNRDNQHKATREIAAAGMVLLKNDNNVLPITKEKYKKIALIGDFADSPHINGQGSAEVYPHKSFIDSPLEELKKIYGNDIEFKYWDIYQKNSYSEKMLWTKYKEYKEFVSDCDLVILFMGSMTSDDTENFDRRSAEINPHYEVFIKYTRELNKKAVVVLQSGSALILGDAKDADSIVQMWLGGEAAGGAVADVLSGRVNPSGKLSETFPIKPRCDLEYPGNKNNIEYKEKMLIGYRYYDQHTDEILYPFGHGLSYTSFEYSNITINRSNNTYEITFSLKNTGDIKGSEIVQLYVGNPDSVAPRPLKELKAFKKVELNAGESKTVSLSVDVNDLGYYNVLLNKWITEEGKYIFYVAASSQDIKLKKEVYIKDKTEYTVKKANDSMVG